LGASASLIWILSITYAIVRYRLMDIRVAIRRTFLRLILAAFAYGTFYGALWFLNQSFGSAWVTPSLITGIFIALIFAFLWPQIEKLTLFFTNKFLYASIYTVQDTISALTQQLTAIIDLGKIITLITDAMLKVLDVECVSVVIKEIDTNAFQIKKRVGFKHRNLSSVINTQNNVLLNWLTQNKQAIVRGELALRCQDIFSKAKKKKLTDIQRLMTDIKAELCLPLIFKDKLIGLIILGKKRSDDAYTTQDIKLLETLANQAAIAIENARFYHQMEQIVAAQTKDLRTKNIRLRKLLKMRREFLNIASHQLRTPISIIKGHVSMLLEDVDKEANSQKREIYQTINIKTEKLLQIVADILYASELDTGKFDLKGGELENIELIPYLASIIKDHQYEAKEKNITLNLKAPAKIKSDKRQAKKKPIVVYASERYLEVILDNLIKNALSYTLAGGKVEVTVKAKRDTVRIEIKDNGIGVPKADQSELFTKFKRGKNANLMHTDGSGLGLFIVKKMIQAHPQGNYGFTSRPNKGSTFWIDVKRA
jgi:signal transduction histidine kinase